MKNFPDHPEISWALRTGYPSWLQERDCGEDNEEESEPPETVWED